MSEWDSSSGMLNITTWAKANYAFARFFANALIWYFLLELAIGFIITSFNYLGEYMLIIGRVLPMLIGAHFAVKGWQSCNIAYKKQVDRKLLSKYKTALTFIVIGNLLILFATSTAYYMLNLSAGYASGVILAPTLLLALICYISVTSMRELIKTALVAPKK